MTWIAAYLATGLFIGFFAGLLGIGGGMMMVPALAALFGAQALAPEHTMHLALGTSMASVFFTGASSVRAHHRLGSVDWDIFWRLGPAMAAGGFLPSLASGWLPQRALALAFAVVVYGASIQIFLGRKPGAGRGLPGTVGLTLTGLLIGLIAGLVSAGGAFLTMPFMLWCGIPIRRAIGTGAALGLPVAVVGTIGYVISGWDVSGLPSGSVGFVLVPALAVLVAASMLMAPYGARAAHRLPVDTLRRIFAFLLFALATRMWVTFW
jgi:uncharacterized membrane protein YfcA